MCIRDSTQAQSADVAAILRDLGVEPTDDRRLIEVWNKADLIDSEARGYLVDNAQRRELGLRPQLVSAITGEGVDALLTAIEERLAHGRQHYRLTLAACDGEGLAWLYENVEVMERLSLDDGSQTLTIRVSPERVERLLRRFPDAVVARQRENKRKRA